mmetsp:Transcript_2131/g.4965  ORF Transcript_2131/g.4965 Transcript_2131/m.4965 type:complete len:111 (+) Transcript_2131:171-503(+)
MGYPRQLDLGVTWLAMPAPRAASWPGAKAVSGNSFAHTAIFPETTSSATVCCSGSGNVCRCRSSVRGVSGNTVCQATPSGVTGSCAVQKSWIAAGGGGSRGYACRVLALQ